MNSISSLMSLKGRRALITGAGGHLGREFANTLADLGADLVLVDHPNSILDAISKNIRDSYGVAVQTFGCDFEFKSQRDELIIKLKREIGELNILVNNAAFVGASNVSGWNVPFEEQSLETWQRALEVNLTSIFHLAQGLKPLMQNADGANILNISSMYGLYAPNWNLYRNTNLSNPAAYGVSKGGVIQLTRWLAATLSPNIRVNAIAPGGILRNQEETFVNQYIALTPLSRMATEQDMLGALGYLCSDLSSFVTGQVLFIDGGFGLS
jgi:NAD(P)-dependent dehydrogenase (short-subunit alcohol dehydrogenase family)